MDIKDVAKEIRAILKKEFPATKFSVKCSRFSQGSSVETSWTDGPTTDQVDELIGHYGNSRSRFIGTSRTHSRELVTQAVAAWREQNPEYAHFTVICKGETSCYAEFNMSEFRHGVLCLEDCEHSLNKIIYGSAFDGTNLICPQEDADDCEPETVSSPEPKAAEVVVEAVKVPTLKPNSTIATVEAIQEVRVDINSEMYRHGYDNAAICSGYVPDISDKQDAIDYSAGLSAGYASRDAIRAHNNKNQQDTQPQPNQLELTADYVVVIYNSYSHPERKNDEPEYFTLDKWREIVGQKAQLTAEAYGCLTSWNMALERMTITAICCNLPKIEALSPQLHQLDLIEVDALEADRQQAYQRYLASQQEADALEAKLAVKKTEAQVYFAIMKEIDEQIQAKKREVEVKTIPQTQPDFDVRTLKGKKVTLILINTMGFPVCRHITVIAADIVSAKRYHGEITDKKCLELQYIEKGKRKPRGTRYTEASLAVALGWQDIKVPTNDGYIDAFDNGLLHEMVSQAKDVVYTQQGL